MNPIRSVSRKKLLFRDCEPAVTPLQQAAGLMFRKKLGRPLLFVFSTEGRRRNAIHSFFCRFPFDAIFLDGDKKVVDVKNKIAPFSLWVEPKSECRYLIECRAGEAKRLGVRVGERLAFRA